MASNSGQRIPETFDLLLKVSKRKSYIRVRWKSKSSFTMQPFERKVIKSGKDKGRVKRVYLKDEQVISSLYKKAQALEWLWKNTDLTMLDYGKIGKVRYCNP